MKLLDRLFIAHADKGKKYIDDMVEQAITEINILNVGEKYKMFEIKCTCNRVFLEALIEKFKEEVLKVFPNIQSDINILELDEKEEDYVCFNYELIFTKS
jgi:hypothetical protein